jgi:cation/acetate symporter
MIALAAVAAVTLGTLGLGAWGVRFVRTTSDLLVASRAVSRWWNAAAISGEYLSAASFLGIAGLELALGTSALWQALGFTAGYLALLLFVAAPLRRFGSYTIPDFAEARLRSPRLRSLASAIVLLICGFYLLPQLKGAGLALNVVTGSPYWVGVLVVATVVAINVAIGGMRGITYVQAFQFWVKLTAIALPVMVLLIHLGGLPGRATLFGGQLPHAGPRGLRVALSAPERVRFPAAGVFIVRGRLVRVRAGAQVQLPRGLVRLPAGGVVPVAAGSGAVAQTGARWSRPVGGSGEAAPLLVYSLLIATFLGTMGLPHILVRFYTNPDGPAARHTTVRVLGLLGIFYLFPAFYGALGRVLTPQLYLTGQADDVVLRVPGAAWPGAVGAGLGALVAAGAFAAFLSTSSGLTVSMAGTISHDIWPRLARRWRERHRLALRRELRWRSAAAARFASPGATGVALRRRRFRVAALLAMLAPALFALLVRSVDIGILVGWAFAIAASSFCPLFLLGIWWAGLTARGALVGMVFGALLATSAILAGLALGEPTGGAGALLTQPAVITVPLAFLAMVSVSLLDARRPDAAGEMLALHAPEGLGLRLAEDEEELEDADLPLGRGHRREPLQRG